MSDRQISAATGSTEETVGYFRAAIGEVNNAALAVSLKDLGANAEQARKSLIGLQIEIANRAAQEYGA